MNNIMLDLETMGNGPQAAIAAVGAVAFDPDTNTIGERLYLPVSLESSVAIGGEMDPATVVWWMKQNDQARALFGATTYPIGYVLDTFGYWLGSIGERKTIKVWGNGAAFDNVILASAYRAAKKPVPWDFWNDRCYRTIKALNKDVPLERIGTHHNAVDDAESQARHLMALLDHENECRLFRAKMNAANEFLAAL